MKVLIAMDSFKGSISSVNACLAVKSGLEKSGGCYEIEYVPMADGGEGTIDAFVAATNGEIVHCEASGLFREAVDGYYGVVNGDTAVVETAVASGITLVPEDMLDPMRATTYGTGEIIKHALDAGYRKIIVGLGGSGTNDGGMGALQALGVKFYDAKGEILGSGGQMLSKVAKIDSSSIHCAIKETQFILATDVENVFCGKTGAAYVFAHQKGADSNMIKELDFGLENFSEILKNATSKDIKYVHGAGAAGGLCGGLMAFFDAQIKSGATVLMEASNLNDKIADADIIITGEGKTDSQTSCGKLPYVITKKATGKIVVIISGSVDNNIDVLYEQGITAAFSIANKPMSLKDAMENAKELIEQTAYNVGRLINVV